MIRLLRMATVVVCVPVFIPQPHIVRLPMQHVVSECPPGLFYEDDSGACLPPPPPVPAQAGISA